MATKKKPTAHEQLTEYRRKRDFGKTAEPSGDETAGKRTSASRKKAAAGFDFVIQKHAASHLHYDLRLELDGVMKSWAVPKGPSADPGVKRLAMQVEDHPMDYNTFEGTIPEGEYGGGTVMLWDVGTYESDKGEGEDAIREGYRKGDLKIVFHGKRMKGSWVLVRTRGWDSNSSKPSWLLIKHRDQYADPGGGDSLTETHQTSVVSKRTMEQIGGAMKKRVWHSNKPRGWSESDGSRPAKKPLTIAQARAARAKAAAKKT